jgi:hypothetical protein
VSTSAIPDRNEIRDIGCRLLQERSPIVVEVRFPRMGTSSDWYSCKNSAELEAVLNRLAAGAEVHFQPYLEDRGRQFWDDCDNARDMIEDIEPALLAGELDRKLRLALCAMVARVSTMDETGVVAQLIHQAESFADGAGDYSQFCETARLQLPAHRYDDPSSANSVRAASRSLLFDPSHLNEKFDAAYYALLYCLESVGRHQLDSEQRAQANIMRDVFVNPFRPVSFVPECRTSNVVSLARGMYESRDFAAMPILGDALQDAGCEQPEILDHCRGGGPHVRGCWVVDLILGKS